MNLSNKTSNRKDNKRMTVEKIKELKRDIIRKMPYSVVEEEIVDFESHTLEQLICDRETIFYIYSKNSIEGAVDAFSKIGTADEFLKWGTKQIQNKLNEVIYYNGVQKENE